MIDPLEIRIGNWVLAYGYEPHVLQVNEIHSRAVVCSEYTPMFTAEGVIACDDDEIFPIPLTPEILEKCGFKDKNMNIDIWDNGIQICRMPLHQDEYYFCIADGSSLSIITESKFKSLHQLQNLYRSLTGEELIYKP